MSRHRIPYLFGDHGVNLCPLPNVDKSDRGVGLPVGKLAKVTSVHGDTVRVRLDRDLNVKVGLLLDRAATVAFLNAPALELVRVPHDDLILGPDADVQRSVVPRVHVGTGLQVDVEPGGTNWLRVCDLN